MSTTVERINPQYKKKKNLHIKSFCLSFLLANWAQTTQKTPIRRNLSTKRKSQKWKCDIEYLLNIFLLDFVQVSEEREKVEFDQGIEPLTFRFPSLRDNH